MAVIMEVFMIHPDTLVTELPSNTKLECECMQCSRKRNLPVTALKDHPFTPLSAIESALKCQQCGSNRVAIFYD